MGTTEPYGDGLYDAGPYGALSQGVYVGALDALVALLADDLPDIRVTRDPSAAVAPCVLVGFPTSFGFTQGGRLMSVPVVLLHSPPADLSALNWLLDGVEALAFTLGSTAGVVVGPYQVGALTYPSVTMTAEITVPLKGL